MLTLTAGIDCEPIAFLHDLGILAVGEIERPIYVQMPRFVPELAETAGPIKVAPSRKERESLRLCPFLHK